MSPFFTVFTFHLFTVFTFFTFHPFTFSPFSPLSPLTPFPFAGLARADPTYESLYTKIYNLAFTRFHLVTFSLFSPFTLFTVFTFHLFHRFHLSPHSTFHPFCLLPGWPGLTRHTNRCILKFIIWLTRFHLVTFSPFSPFTFSLFSQLSPHRFHLFTPFTAHPLAFCRAGPGLTRHTNYCILKFIICLYFVFTLSHFHCFHLSPFSPFSQLSSFTVCIFSPFSPLTPFPFAGLARADPTYESLYTKIYNLACTRFHLVAFSQFSPFTFSQFSPFSAFTFLPFHPFSPFTPFHFAGLARADPTNELLYTEI